MRLDEIVISCPCRMIDRWQSNICWFWKGALLNLNCLECWKSITNPPESISWLSYGVQFSKWFVWGQSICSVFNWKPQYNLASDTIWSVHFVRLNFFVQHQTDRHTQRERESERESESKEWRVTKGEKNGNKHCLINNTHFKWIIFVKSVSFSFGVNYSDKVKLCNIVFLLSIFQLKITEKKRTQNWKPRKNV